MKEITVQELKAKMDNGEDFHLIDVREPEEYEEVNNGAQLIPLGELDDHLEELKKWKDDEIIMMCRSGHRSGLAQEKMLDQGFTNVANLTGGILAWQEMTEEEE